MAIIKYYLLESRAKDAPDSLTASLQKRMLSEKAIAGLLSSHIEDTIEAEAKAVHDAEARDQAHDAEEFEVLYRQSYKLDEGKEKLFGRNILPNYSTEIVVKGSASDIMLLQEYLADSEFDVIKVKTVSKAAFSFGTEPTRTDKAHTFKGCLYELAKKESGLECIAGVSDDNPIYTTSTVEYTCDGVLRGDVEQVLRLRQIINGMAKAYLPIKRESVQFY